jgi:hypothetical protein
MIASGVTNIVLLVVGAAWLAVLVPPLLRGRVENSPGSSIVDFRRQLASLQRAVPTQGVTPMRQMARPLAPAARSHGSAARAHAVRSTATLERPVARAGSPARPVAAPRPTSRHELQQRRKNVVTSLGGLTLTSAMLAFATASSTLTYVFVLSAISLAGYCYKLVQLKNAATLRTYGR